MLKPLTPESISKRSLAQTLVNKIEVTDISTGHITIYHAIKAAAKDLNLEDILKTIYT
ncbi:MAG: hypothetical protein EOP34_01750 [Rickettsiales bacterium]|nr:MAG: hypothetical protein EOP34_01750 [Rickettsiales bacterium]